MRAFALFPPSAPALPDSSCTTGMNVRASGLVCEQVDDYGGGGSDGVAEWRIVGEGEGMECVQSHRPSSWIQSAWKHKRKNRNISRTYQ